MTSTAPIPDNCIFDTTVFVDHLRNKYPTAKSMIDAVIAGDVSAGISLITDMELWAGVRDKSDERRHKILLSKFRRVPFQLTIARRAGEIAHACRAYKPSCTDLIIAASAEYQGMNIVTRNPKHFTCLSLRGVQVIAYTQDAINP